MRKLNEFLTNIVEKLNEFLTNIVEKILKKSAGKIQSLTSR
jgi:uncharacterized protein YutE (UPF0331/DUF86 family)